MAAPCWGKSITKVIWIYLLRTRNVCMQFHSNFSNILPYYAYFGFMIVLWVATITTILGERSF